MKTMAIFAATLILVACADAPAPSPKSPRHELILLNSQASGMRPVGCTPPRLGDAERTAAVVELLRTR